MSAENKLRVGIVRLSALGDIVHSLGVLPFLKDALEKSGKKAHFTWFVDSSFYEILRDCPYIDEIVELPLQKALKSRDFRLLKSIKESLKKYKFDIVIDMQGLLKSALVARLLNSPRKVGFSFFSAREGLASLFYNQKIKISYKDNVLNRGAAVAFGAFNLPVPPLLILQNPPPIFYAKKLSQSEIESQKNNGLADFFASKIKVLCILKTSQVKKNYPISQFLELARLLCEKCGIKPFFLTQKEPQSSEITSFAYNLYGLNLSQIKSIISECDLVIGGDTGFSHLAWGFGVPSLTLFSNVWKNTNRERTELKRAQNRALEANEFSALSAQRVCKEANELLNAKINSKRNFALDSMTTSQESTATASENIESKSTESKNAEFLLPQKISPKAQGINK